MHGWRNVKRVLRATEGNGLGIDRREKQHAAHSLTQLWKRWYFMARDNLMLYYVWNITFKNSFLFFPDYKAYCRNFVKYIKAFSIKIIAPNIILVF